MYVDNFIKQNINYDCLIIDEVHQSLTERRSVLYTMATKVYGLTGTLPTHNKVKMRMLKQQCPVRTTYTMDDALNDKFITPFKIYGVPVKNIEKGKYNVFNNMFVQAKMEIMKIDRDFFTWAGKNQAHPLSKKLMMAIYKRKTIV